MPKIQGFIKVSWKLSVVVILIIGVIAAVILVQHRNNFLNFAANPQVILNLIPNGVFLNQDQETTLQVIINTQGREVESADIHLRYNANVIVIDSIEKGNFFSVVTDSKIESGEARISLSALPPKKGIGIAAKVKVRALVRAPTDIIFDKSSIVKVLNYEGNAISQTYGTKIYDNPDKVPKSFGNTTIPEGAVYTDPDPFIRDLTRSPLRVEMEQESVKPAFSAEYAKYLLSLPVKQIQKLNDALEERTSKIIK